MREFYIFPYGAPANALSARPENHRIMASVRVVNELPILSRIPGTEAARAIATA